jgi:hypothetical protein
MSLKGNKNYQHWEDLVGYTILELKEHLEKQFTEGMTWDNYGLKNKGWHVDHKVAKVYHNYTNPRQYDFIRAWSLDNLQPMWGIDNIKKGTKLLEPFQPALAIEVKEGESTYVYN